MAGWLRREWRQRKDALINVWLGKAIWLLAGLVLSGIAAGVILLLKRPSGASMLIVVLLVVSATMGVACLITMLIGIVLTERRRTTEVAGGAYPGWSRDARRRSLSVLTWFVETEQAKKEVHPDGAKALASLIGRLATEELVEMKRDGTQEPKHD